MTRLSTYLKTALAAAALMTLAACGGSNDSSAAGSGSGAASGGSTPSAGSGGKVEVETHSGPLGTYLTDSSGRTLYMFASDTSSTSTCTGACQTYWPPLTTSSPAEASGSATAAMLGAISSGSSKQITYAGHPLYYYAGDNSPGDTKGQGSDNFGAKWWIVAASGKPITSSSGTTSTSAGSGGAYG